MDKQEIYVSGYTETRLRFQEGRRAASHAAFLLPHLRSGQRLLDCGCGTGSITNDLAAWVGDGFVIGVDIEPSQCSKARKAAREAGIVNAFYEQQDVKTLEFADATFDAVFAHAILDHVSDARRALAEMYRVLRPGGLLAIRSPDWSAFQTDPKSEATENCMSMYQDRIRAGGGDPVVAHRLPEFLGDFELARIDRTGSPEAHMAPDKPPHRLAETICEILRRGDIPVPGCDPAIIDRECEEMKAWAAREGARVEERWIEFLCYKP